MSLAFVNCRLLAVVISRAKLLFCDKNTVGLTVQDYNVLRGRKSTQKIQGQSEVYPRSTILGENGKKIWKVL